MPSFSQDAFPLVIQQVLLYALRNATITTVSFRSFSLLNKTAPLAVSLQILSLGSQHMYLWCFLKNIFLVVFKAISQLKEHVCVCGGELTYCFLLCSLWAGGGGVTWQPERARLLCLPTSQKDPCCLVCPMALKWSFKGRKHYLAIEGTQIIVATSFSQETAMPGVFTPMNPALWKLGEENHKFQTSLIYIVRQSFNKSIKINKEERNKRRKKGRKQRSLGNSCSSEDCHRRHGTKVTV